MFRKIIRMMSTFLRLRRVLFFYFVSAYFDTCSGVIYTYEDVELRRLFPKKFPLDTIRKGGAVDPEHLGRNTELESYFKHPKYELNSHFEELTCYENNGKKTCKVDVERYTPGEDSYYMSRHDESHVDRRRVYCILLLCFTEDELDRVVVSF